MRRYLPILLMACFLIVSVIAGSYYVAGYAGDQSAANIPSITLYTTLPTEQVNVIAQEYEKNTHVVIRIVPLSEQELAAKLQIESSSPRADIILANSSILQQARKTGELIPYTSEIMDIIPDRFQDPGNYWTGVWYDPIIWAANQDYLRQRGQDPAKWSDLVTDENIQSSQDAQDPKLPKNAKTASPRDPLLKGAGLRIGLTDFLAADAAANLLYTFAAVYGEEKTLDYLGKLHPNVIQYAKFLATPVRMAGMGEVDVAVAVQSEALRYIRNGFPLKILYPADGTAYLLTAAALVKGGPHTAEAKQFMEWLVQDAAFLALEKNDYFFIPANPDTHAYKEYADKDLKLFVKEKELSGEQQRKLLDKWVQTVRLGIK